jgi:hypothetical protein
MIEVLESSDNDPICDRIPLDPNMLCTSGR